MADETAIEMYVGGLVLDPSTQAPIVVLKDESGQVALPIWIGMAEATSIASAIKGVPLARPLTHDLMYSALVELGVSIQRVMITELKESTYFAELVISHGDRVIVQDSRPSDAIALAIRASAPIYVAEKVLQQAKVAMEESKATGSQQANPSTNESSTGVSESDDQAEQPEEGAASDFKSINKDKWEEILNQLDPDDFKYKV